MDCDVHKSKVKDNTASRFGPLVNDNDGELRIFLEGQENRNTKFNTKWALNVFEKWRVFGEFGILKTTTQKDLARTTNTLFKNYPTLHQFCTAVSLFFSFWI